MTQPNKNGKKTSDHDLGGKFAKGNKASPGRPPGRGVVAELRDKLAQDVDKVIAKVREQALAGDPQSIRILLDRVVPALRPIELPAPIAMPAGDLTQQAQAVIQAAAAGELAPGQATQLLQGLGALAKIIEIDDLAKRIKALEDKNAKP